MGKADITSFGTAKTGEAVTKITLQNDDLRVSIITWGAALQDLRFANGDRALTQGSDLLSDYEGDMCHHGTLIGPVVNRISNARITLDGMTYELERNQDGRIHLHSGAQATHRCNWDVVTASDTHVTLRIALGDGACGLPGNREITATYRLDGPTLDLTIDGTTDEITAMSFANHSYWNLDGTARWDGHRLRVSADRYLPSTPENYPTGDIANTTGTVMDFRVPRTVTVNNPDFDHNFCLSDAPTDIRDVLWLTGQSGVQMVVATDQPGIQIYDGRDAVRPGHSAYESLAIEAQYWPDAPNNPAFPSIIVSPDAPYRQHTRFTFSHGT